MQVEGLAGLWTRTAGQRREGGGGGGGGGGAGMEGKGGQEWCSLNGLVPLPASRPGNVWGASAWGSWGL